MKVEICFHLIYVYVVLYEEEEEILNFLPGKIF